MKTNMKESIRTENIRTWKGAAAKGALVWGSLYSTATSGAAMVLAPLAGNSLTFSDVFTDSLVIFPSAGAAQGYLAWKMKRKEKNKSELPLECFTSRSRKPHKHPLTLKRAS